MLRRICPCKFPWLSPLGIVTARHSSSGRQPNFAALNKGHHLYSAGRPSRSALAHILGNYLFLFRIGQVNVKSYSRRWMLAHDMT